VAILALRSLSAAWIVRRARRQRPGPAPSVVQAAGRALVFYATASVLLWPWVVLLFGGAISHLSYLYFAALPPYRHVAEAYNETLAKTSAPAPVLVAEADVPVPTVRRWIAEARRRGLLPPGRQGRAG
jgi:hypothetical protein